MKEKFLRYLATVSSVLSACMLVVLFSTCDIGLGASVDTEAPTLTIEYPPASAVIRDYFTFGGTCSDDVIVSKVEVTVTNTELTKDNTWTFTATISSNQKSWYIEKLNEADATTGAYPFPDGKYELSAVAYDRSSHSSGISSRSFEVDNTAPLFIIKSPSSTKITSPTAYGAQFKITGTIAEDHTVKTMAVSIYDKDGNAIDSTNTTPYTASNVETAGGTSVTIAKYLATGTETLNTRYNTIYDAGDTSLDTRAYSCSVKLVDSAKEYKDMSVDEDNNNTLGNETTVFYLSDDVKPTLDADQLEAGDVKKILNGTYRGNATEETQTAIKTLFAEKKNSTAAFSLNPDASPKYSVTGYKFNAITSEGTSSVLISDNAASAKQKVTVVATAGRDETYVNPATIVVYQFGPYASNEITDTLVSSVYSDPASYAKANASLSHKLLNEDGKEDNTAYDAGTVETYTYPVYLFDTIETNKNYLIAVTGVDASNVDMTPQDGCYYGFIGANSGTPPALNWDAYSNTNTTANIADLGYASTNTLSFSGTATSKAAAITSVAYTVTVTDESSTNNGKEIATYVGNATLGSTGSMDTTWSFALADATNFIEIAADKEYLYTVTMKVSDENGGSTEGTKRIHVDTTKPSVTISAVTPTVIRTIDGKACVNGTVGISCAIVETNLSSSTYKVFVGTAAEPSKEGTLSGFNPTLTLDTTAFTNESTISVIVTTIDKAGNMGSYTTWQYNKEANLLNEDFVIDQSTDKPTISFSNVDATINSDVSEEVGKNSIKKAYANVKAGNASLSNIFGTTSNNIILGTINDDDGVKKVTVGYRAFGNTGAYTTKDLLTNGTKTTYSLSYALPTTYGAYDIEVLVEDTAGEATSYNSNSTVFVVAVDDGAPTFSNVTPTDGGYYTSTVTVAGKVTDASGEVSIKLTSEKETGSAYANAVTTTATEATLADKFTISGTDAKNTAIYTATDKYGQEKTYSIIYNVDKTPPTIGTITTNPSANGSWISNSSPTISVPVQDPVDSLGNHSGLSSVEYVLNGSSTVGLSINGDVDENNYYTYTGVLNLSQGTNNVVVKATDKATNSTTSSTLTFLVDSVSPTITVGTYDSEINGTEYAALPATGITLTPTILDAGSGVVKAWVTTDGSASDTFSASTTVASATTAATTDEWKPSLSIAKTSLATNKIYTFYVIAEDDSNRITVSDPITITVDTTAPVLSISNLASNKTIYETNSYITESSGTYSYSVRGKWSDNVSGTETLYYKQDGAADWTAMAVDDAPKVTTQASWEKVFTIAQGTNKSFEFYAVDAFGNTSDTYPYTGITFDLSAPVITMETSPATTAKIGDTVTLKGSVYDALAMPSTAVSGSTGYGVTVTGTCGANTMTFDVNTFARSEDGKTVTFTVSKTITSTDETNIINGTWKFTIAAADNTGRPATGYSYSTTIDAVYPTITFTNTTPYYAVNTIPQTFSGSITDNSGVTGVYYTVLTTASMPTYGTGTWKSASIDSDTAWSVNANLSDKDVNIPLYIYFAAKDAVGNATISSGYATVTLDNAVPTVTITPTTATVSKDAVTISGTVTEKNLGSLVVTYTLDGESKGTYIEYTESTSPKLSALSTGSSAEWSFSLPTTTNGKYVFTVTATDKAAQSATATSSTVLIDSTAPTFVNENTTKFSIGGKEYSTDNWYNDTSLSFTGYYSEATSGSGIANVYYWQNNNVPANLTTPDVSTANASFAPNTSTGTCKFNATIGSFAGNSATNTIYFAAKDEAGNVSVVSGPFTVKVDSSAPTLGLSRSDTVLSNAGTALTLTGTVDDTASGVDTNSISATTGTITCTSTTYTLSLTTEILSGLSDGIKVINATVKDKAGNSYTGTIATISIDKKVPTVTYTSPAANATVNKTITISGTASDNNSLVTGAGKGTLYIKKDPGNYDSGTVIDIAEDGSWSTTLDTFTSDYFNTATPGTLTWYVVVKDTAGNSSVDTNTRSVTVSQNADRPIIKLNNLKTAGSTLTSTTIYGTVTDDDGTPTPANFYISEDGATWINSTTNTGTESDPIYRVTYENGSWTYTPSSGDGTKAMYFKVIDNAATPTMFTSTPTVYADGLALPYVRGTAYVSPSTDQNTFVAYKLDTNPPTIESVQITMNGGTAQTLVNNMVFGKNNPTFTITVKANDTSGIAKVSAQFGSLTAIANTITGSTSNASITTTLTGLTAPTTANLNEQEDLAIVVYDNSGAKATYTRNVTVDNKDPTIIINYPTSGAQVTGDVEVRGTASDGGAGTGVKKVSWYVPDNTTVAAWSGKSAAQKYACDWTELTGTATWAIEFTDTVTVEGYAGTLKKNFFHSETSGETTTWYNYPSTGNASTTYGTETAVGSNIWALPLYFRIEDAAGNITYATDYTINVNPDGDRPTAAITYPEVKKDEDDNIVLGGVILGGTIRLFGTAEDNVSVSSVHMQIQKAKYAVSGNTDTDGLPLYNLQKSNGAYVYEDITGATDVTVKNTTSWNHSIDGTTTTYGPTGTYISYLAGNTNPNTYGSNSDYYNKSVIRVRVWALDNNNLKGSYSDWVEFTIDKNAPKIGSTNSLTLVQYTDNADGTGDVTASMAYSSGMYISGTWWLTFSVEDESGISSCVVSTPKVTSIDNLTSPTATATISLGTGTPISEGSSYKNYYSARIKVVTTLTGAAKFTITASDNSDPTKQSSDSAVYLKFDNTAPVQNALLHGTATIGDGTNSTVKVSQDNYTYLISSSVAESGSGLTRTAIYFKRTAAGTTRVYDPRFAQAITGDDAYNKIVIDDDAVISATACNSLPYNSYTATRSSTDSFTLTTADKFITKGSIVRIAGVYRLVSAVSTDGLTYTFTPAVSTDVTTVEAIYALVIDNTKYETLSNGVVGNDDGDGVYDSVVDEGSYYSWKVAFNSENIPDGPLTICCVSFDEAGNASDLYTVATKVENNAPRIAKIQLGTDLNGNNEISEDEYISYSTLVKNGTTDLYEAVENATVDATSDFTAKAKTVIVPEFIGGNNAFQYTWKYQYRASSSAEWGAETPGSSTLVALTTNNVSRTLNGETITTRNGTVTLAATDEKLGGIISDGQAKLIYTFWDSTEGTTPGTDSLSATANIALNVDVVDDTSPKVVIAPFHYTSSDDNSTTITTTDGTETTTTKAGHIDLEADWMTSSKYVSTATSGEYDGDPKVSGQIVVNGTAYDDHLLSALYMTIDGFTFPNAETSTTPSATAFGFNADGTTTAAPSGATYYKVATCSSGTWTGSDYWSTYGWLFKVTPDSLGQSGHSVKWELYWDSSKLATTVGLDKVIRIIAVDARSEPNASSETAGTGNTPSYKIDVVPYITSVKTGLSAKNTTNPSVFNRASDGHYPVYENEKVTVSGYNFTISPTVKLNETTFGTTSLTGATNTSFIVDLGSTATSGALTVSISDGTTAIAALNNENANDNVAYNARPNGINNNLLTDDVYFDMWEYTTIASPAVSALSNPTVKVGPTGQIGASFSNLLFFNMAGYRNSGETNGASTWCTQTPFMLAYNGCSTNTFAFDSNGYTYGSVQYQTNNSQALSGYYWFMFSKANQIKTMDNEHGYLAHYGASRIEANAVNLLAGPNAGWDDSEWITNLNRIESPAIVPVASSATSVTVHMAYVDSTTHQVRYRQGVVNPSAVTYNTGGSLRDIYATAGSLLSTNYDQTGLTKGKGDYFHKYPYKSGESATSGVRPQNPPDSLQNIAGQAVSVIASSGVELASGDDVMNVYKNSTDHTYAHGAGDYCDMATSDGNVIIAWNDADSGKALYTWITSENLATATASGTSNAARTTLWEANAKTVGDGGEYVKIVVDAAKHLHMAYYDSNSGDLKYAYIPALGVTPVISTVDSYSDVGEHITLTVVQDGTNYIPYIGYYSNKLAKVAYRTDFTDVTKAADGAEGDMFTGKWRVTFVPSSVAMIKEDTVNVCMYSTGGAITAIPTNAQQVVSYANDKAGTNVPGNSTRVYGNGTKYPIAAYISKAGALEMAQMK